MATQRTALLSRLAPLTPQTIYLVGGSVRDLLSGVNEIKDIDIVVPTGSAKIAQTFADEISGSFFFLDEPRKMSRVVLQRPGDAALQFDFSDFTGRDLAADLGRRDFTMNAMALDLRVFLQTGAPDAVVDLFEGRADVMNRVVRAVKPEALDDDPLRLLRAVRFAATLGFTIEAETAESIRRRSALLTQAAPERIRDEFFQIVSQRNADRFLLLMDSLSLLAGLLPELDALTGFTPGKYHSFDVRTHSLKAVAHVDSVLDDLPALSPEHAGRIREHLETNLEQFVSRTAAVRFAGLLHDIAKPDTLSRDADGHIHFYGHDALGAEKAKDICRRFRLSRATESLVTAVIRQHMRLFNLSRPGGPSRNALYRYCRDLGDAVPESLILSQADARATYEIMPKEKFTDTEKPMAVVLDYYFSRFIRTEEKPLVTGQDLIDRGLTPGPRFSRILDDIRERQATGTLRDRQEALLYLDSLKHPNKDD